MMPSLVMVLEPIAGLNRIQSSVWGGSVVRPVSSSGQTSVKDVSDMVDSLV